jgi:hypothetical protein
MQCDGGLADRLIVIEGLQSTLTDVLVRIQQLDGGIQTVRLQPDEPGVSVVRSPSSLALIGSYLGLGIEHILLGYDHLLFVLALLLIVSGWRRLVATITAFTMAHSITLVAATLGWVRVPQQPVEAVIALSILFLASEIVHGMRGRQSAGPDRAATLDRRLRIRSPARPRLRRRTDGGRSARSGHPACLVVLQHRGRSRATGIRRRRAGPGLRAASDSDDPTTPESVRRQLPDRRLSGHVDYRAGRGVLGAR